MQKSPSDEARRWLEQAEEDFKSARILLEHQRYDMACFAFQQVSEKALKSYLYGQGEEFVLGHSVTHLLEDCAVYDPVWNELGKEVSGLDSFYIPTRYPNGLPDSIPARVYHAPEAEQAQAMAEKVMLAVKTRIKPKA